MKRYLLIVAGLCLVACGGNKKTNYYFLLNSSNGALQVDSHAFLIDEQVPQDASVLNSGMENTHSRFSFKEFIKKTSAELVQLHKNPVEVKEPGHYVWNGSEAIQM